MLQVSSKFTIAVHMLAVIEFLNGKEKVTSKILAGSIGVNPVVIRSVMKNLKEANLIKISQGKSGIQLNRTLDEISFYDIYKATEWTNNEGVFHFHENPNPDCPIGRNIHNGMDSKLDRIEKQMENEMKSITVADVMKDIKTELENGN